MIKIDRTYSEVTPESAEAGDFSDTGFIAEGVECSFRELVDLLRSHTELSRYPARGDSFEWYSTPFETTDYRTGTQRSESVHYSRNNLPRSEKYWAKAARAAGIAIRSE